MDPIAYSVPEKMILIEFDNARTPIYINKTDIGYYLLTEKILENERVLFIRDIFEYLKPVTEELLDRLEPNEREVIILRYGLKTGIPLGLADVAAVLRYKMVKVRDCEQHAMDVMKEPGNKALIETLVYGNADMCDSYSSKLDFENKYGEWAEKFLINEAVEYKQNAGKTGGAALPGYFEELFHLVSRKGYSALYDDINSIDNTRPLHDVVRCDRRHSAFFNRPELIREIMSFPTDTDRGTPITRLRISPTDMRRIMNKGCLYANDVKDRFPAVLFDPTIGKAALRSILMTDAVPIAAVTIPDTIYGLIETQSITSLSDLLSINLRNNRELKQGLTEFLNSIGELCRECNLHSEFTRMFG